MSTDISKVSIAIRPTMYARLEDMPNTPSHAIAEFIDNALQSSIDKRQDILQYEGDYKLKVDIDIDWSKDLQQASKITIRDNAGGINHDKFLTAFEPAKAPEDDNGLNEFGMGLKTAACWLGKKWSVTSKALGEDVERGIAFDLQNVVNDSLENLPVISHPEAKSRHYTIITIEECTKNAPFKKNTIRIRDELASIYRKFLRSKQLEIIFCGEVLSFSEYEILCAPFYPREKQKPEGESKYWRKDIMVSAGKYKITGFIGILRDIDSRHNGLVLLRRGRVVMGETDGMRYFPKFCGSSGTFRYKRLFGELELEGFDVSFNKNDIQNKDDLEFLMEMVADNLHYPEMNLLAQADNYRLDDTARHAKKLVKAHNSATKLHGSRVNVVPLPRNETTDVPTTPEDIAPTSIVNDYTDEYEIGNELYTLKVAFSDTENPSRAFWLDSKDKATKKLCLIINLKHVFFEHFGSPRKDIIAIIKSIYMAQFAAQHAGTDTIAEFNDYFAEILKKTKV